MPQQYVFTTVIVSNNRRLPALHGATFSTVQERQLGGSAPSTPTVAIYLYEKAFGGTQFDFGYAAATAWCFFMLMHHHRVFVNYL